MISRHLSHIIEHLLNCCLYRLNRLSWFFSYPSLPEYHSILISAMSQKVSDLTEFYVLRNVSARHLTSACDGKMSDSAIDGYVLVQLRLPAYLCGKSPEWQKPTCEICLCQFSSGWWHRMLVNAQSGWKPTYKRHLSYVRADIWAGTFELYPRRHMRRDIWDVSVQTYAFGNAQSGWKPTYKRHMRYAGKIFLVWRFWYWYLFL